MIEISFVDQPTDADGALAIIVAEGALSFQALHTLPEAQRSIVVDLARKQSFAGKVGQVVDLTLNAGTIARRILIVGNGDQKFEAAGGEIAARLLTSGETSVAVVVDQGGEAAADVALGLSLRSWRFDRYRSEIKDGKRVTLTKAEIVGGCSDADDAWTERAAVVEGTAFARTLVAEPGNILFPETFVDRCRMLEEHGVELEIIDGAAMSKLGMNALLGVSQGSAKAPYLLCMRWRGAEGRPIALVGKGVTFDTGGISIKPSAAMDEMKTDMGGAAAVAGAMLALARRKAKAHVVGVCGLVENMPDGLAQRPGDIVTSMSGRTIEVLDTDAEGRLVLCDALTWVQRTHKPSAIIDLATLTGSIIVALGNEFAGLYANGEGIAETLLAASQQTGERIWRMPLDPAYDALIDSEIADVKNLGPRAAGSVTAAQFLQRFIDDDTRWAHLDIAGKAWSTKDTAIAAKGATGFGVRLLDRFVSNYAKV